MTETHLQAGELLWVDRTASVQFVEPILIRLIRVLDQPTYDGWAWIEVYQMDRSGDAIARREIFVQPRKLRRVPNAATRHRPSRPTRQETGSPGMTNPANSSD
jgi:hypothetical protein